MTHLLATACVPHPAATLRPRMHRSPSHRRGFFAPACALGVPTVTCAPGDVLSPLSHAAARRSTPQHAAARGSSWQLVAAAARPQAAFTAHPFTPSPLPRATIRHPVRRPRATIPSGQSATTTGTTRVRVSATCERVPCINGTCVSVTRRHHNNMCMRIHSHGELHQSRPSPPSG